METSIINQLRQQRDHELSEIEKCLKKKQQAKNQLARLKNKQRYLSQKERSRRTHQLCNIGGALAHFFPKLMELSRDEIYDFVEKLSAGGDKG